VNISSSHEPDVSQCLGELPLLLLLLLLERKKKVEDVVYIYLAWGL
jgi:hypothetical protein